MAMTRRLRSLTVCSLLALAAQGQTLKSAPPLAMEVVPNWAKLPRGWNFGQTTGVAVDRDDNVWVFNRGAHPIVQFDKDGNFLQEFAEPQIVSAHGIKVDPEGNIWAVDVKGHAILKFNPAGRLLAVLGGLRTPGNNDAKENFNEPTALAFAANGDFFVADGYKNARVVKYTKDGEYIRHWGRPGQGDGEFNLVHDVCLDALGRVYVADRANSRVQIFDAEGKYLGKWTEVGQPWGLAYSPRDNAIYMADGRNDRVVKLNLDGQVLGVLGGHGKVPGKFDFAHHLAIDSSGALYVAEIKNWRVQKFVPR
jgi:DNA-binding beta-propeller fold protein YncE